MDFTPDSAKRFLLSRVDEQAAHDGAALDDIERRMFLFSESSGNPGFEAQESFDSNYDPKAYESKVAKLLRRSYAHDKRTVDGKTSWNAALKKLSREDFYGLVMVDQAKIPRAAAGSWLALLRMLPFAAVEIVILGVGLVLVFWPAILGLYLPDWFRLLLLPLFLWLFWYAGKIFGQIELAKAAKRAASAQR